MLALVKRIGQGYFCSEVANAQITSNLEELKQLSWRGYDAMRPVCKKGN